VLLDEHGHMLPVTAPDRTADVIRRVAARLQLPIYKLVNSSE
jgi:hypothetical protein